MSDSIPSDDYLDYLKNIDVRAVTTIAGRCIVGEYHSDTEDGLMLINPFVFDTAFGVEPLYRSSFNVPALIRDDRIETEMIAGIGLKKEYYDEYMKYRVEMFDTDVDLGDYFNPDQA